jgi:hypothetical protein
VGSGLIDNIKNPLVIFYRENEGQWLSYWNNVPDKTYSDIFDNDDIKQTFVSIAFISTRENKINYITNFRRDRLVATQKVRVLFDIVIKLEKPLSLDFIILQSSGSMKNSIKNIFTDKSHVYYLNENQLNTIIHSLTESDENNKNFIDRILYRDRIIQHNNNRDYIVSTERDALGLIFRMNDLDEEINSIVNWNIEKDATPDFINGLRSVSVREDQAIINDLRRFSDWKVIREYVSAICTLSNGKNCVSVIYANRTKIESNIGVDLIYYDHNHKTFIFVQYKRLKDANGRHIYRPLSDKNLFKEIQMMENFESILSKNIGDYRINDEIFYFKFCKERQEIYTKDLSSGFYMPKDYFLLVNKLQEEKNQHKIVSYDTINRYLTNTVFIELVKSGLIGSKINDMRLIVNIIKELLSTENSLIFAVSNPITDR